MRLESHFQVTSLGAVTGTNVAWTFAPVPRARQSLWCWGYLLIASVGSPIANSAFTGKYVLMLDVPVSCST